MKLQKFFIAEENFHWIDPENHVDVQFSLDIANLLHSA